MTTTFCGDLHEYPEGEWATCDRCEGHTGDHRADLPSGGSVSWPNVCEWTDMGESPQCGRPTTAYRRGRYVCVVCAPKVDEAAAILAAQMREFNPEEGSR